MTIRYPDRFRRAEPAGFDGLFHWDFLLRAFKRGIPSIRDPEPMDFDAVVEVNHRWLVFETKSPGVAIPYGQRHSLEKAVETGYFTVFFLPAKTAAEICWFEIWEPTMDGKFKQKRLTGTAEDVVREAQRWFEYHDRRRRTNWKINNTCSLDFSRCQTCGQPIDPLEF